jgi:hypothetical protein
MQLCSGGHNEWHILGDALYLIDGDTVFYTVDGKMHKIEGKWDLIIAHPPCTYLSNAGATRLFPDGVLNEDRYKHGLEAKDFFMHFYNADCKYIAVENPVPSRIYELPKYTQIVQPYEYGHPFQKRTCLWLKGLPKLVPTNILPPDQRESTVTATWFNTGSGKDRQRNRSKTFQGIAEAMAKQWSAFIESQNQSQE